MSIPNSRSTFAVRCRYGTLVGSSMVISEGESASGNDAISPLMSCEPPLPVMVVLPARRFPSMRSGTDDLESVTPNASIVSWAQSNGLPTRVPSPLTVVLPDCSIDMIGIEMRVRNPDSPVKTSCGMRGLAPMPFTIKVLPSWVISAPSVRANLMADSESAQGL